MQVLEEKVKSSVRTCSDRNTQFSLVVPATVNTVSPSHYMCSDNGEILYMGLLCAVFQFTVFLLFSALYYSIPVYKSFKCAHYKSN